jgi:hypothetical protein
LPTSISLATYGTAGAGADADAGTITNWQFLFSSLHIVNVSSCLGADAWGGREVATTLPIAMKLEKTAPGIDVVPDMYYLGSRVLL